MIRNGHRSRLARSVSGDASIERVERFAGPRRPSWRNDTCMCRESLAVAVAPSGVSKILRLESIESREDQ